MNKTKPLENIVINPESGEIEINPEPLIQETEDRLHNQGDMSNRAHFLKHRKHGWWPEEKRIEVASLYAAGVVSSRDLARLTGVPDTAIRTWRTQDWWPELLEKIHSTADNDIVSKFTKIVDTSLEVIQDRLINGDHIYNKKTGEIHRKPVSMRDTAAVTNTIVDKRQLLRGKATSRTEKVSVDARLLKLAEEFKRFTEAKEISPELKEITLDAT